MNEFKARPKETKQSIDTKWKENLDAIEGRLGLPQNLMKRSGKDIFSRFVNVLKDQGALPLDLDNPETSTEVEAVDVFARELYNIACELEGIAEEMMVGEQVGEAYNDMMEDAGNTRDWYAETGHRRGDF